MQRQDIPDYSLNAITTALTTTTTTFETDPLHQQTQLVQSTHHNLSSRRPSISIMTSLPPASSMTPLINSPSTQLPSPRSYRTSAYQWPVPTTPTRSYPVTPTTGTPLNTADWSVKDIIDMYKDDPESLKTVLTAKAEEDKRRAAEEAFKAEQLRLQWKQVELEIIREQNRSGIITSGSRYGTGSGGPTPTNTQPPPNPFRISSPEYPNNGGNYSTPSPSTFIPPEIIHTAPPVSPITGPTYTNIYQPMQYIPGPQAQVDYGSQPPMHTTITLNQPTIPNRGASQQQQKHPQPHPQQSHSQPPPHHSQLQPHHTYYQPHQDYHPQPSPSYGYPPNGYNTLTPTSANTVRQMALPVMTSAPQHLQTPSHGYPASPSEYGTLSPMSTASPRSPNTAGHKRKRNSTSSHHGFIGDKIDRSTSPSENKIKKETDDGDSPKLTHGQIMEAVRAKVLRGVAISNAAEKAATGDVEVTTANASKKSLSLSPSPRVKHSPSVASPHFPAEDPSTSRPPTLTTHSPCLSVKSPLISANAANVMLGPRVGVSSVDGAEE